MTLKNICFIVPNYPYKNENVYTFVRQVVTSMADLDIKCTVIAPQSLSKRFLEKKGNRPYHWVDITKNGFKIDIYQPLWMSFSTIKIFGKSLSSYLMKSCVIRTFRKLKITPDVLYGHFWESGVIAGEIGQKYCIPVFVATGESTIQVHKKFSSKVLGNSLKDVCGVICVSTKNMVESLTLGLATREKMTVIPNAIDESLFYKIDYQNARRKLKIDSNDFVVAFTGSFSERKGVMRLSKAIENLPGIKAIYIGSGEEKPSNNGLIFSGNVQHNKIVEYLNAADIFVLPTLAEGCCNAIIEAMACGLPIVSSNLSFNDDILNETNSIRIDPNSIDEISEAIQVLAQDKNYRKQLSDGALVTSKNLSIKVRVETILDFIKKKTEERC